MLGAKVHATITNDHFALLSTHAIEAYCQRHIHAPARHRLLRLFSCKHFELHQEWRIESNLHPLWRRMVELDHSSILFAFEGGIGVPLLYRRERDDRETQQNGILLQSGALLVDGFQFHRHLL